MQKTVFNFYPIIQLLAFLGGIFIIIILINTVKDIVFKNNDTKITKGLIDKFPLVSLDFINKSSKEQNIENNQEIHQLNERVEHLEEYVQDINAKIFEKLDKILKEGKRG